jgi:NodT family efflux transporter outer membrane factor (OMF) lipoprotein
MRLGAASLLALLALQACAGPYRPAPGDAQLPPPSQWRREEGTIKPISDGWWRAFGDPALDRLVAQALAGNEDLKIAAARIEEARAQLRLTDARRLPTLGLGLSGASSRSVNAFGIGVDQEQGQAAVSSAYEVDLFGRLRQSSEAARADLLATDQARAALRLSLIATVVDGYIGLRALDSRLEIVNETIATRGKERDLIHRRYAAGYASLLDDRQAAAAYEAAARLRPATQKAISARENALGVLAGTTPGPIARDRDVALAADMAIPSSLPSQLLRQRPDIAEAESRVAAADHRLGAARAAFMPQLQLSASGGAAVSTLLSSPITIFNLGGSLLTPLFEGGRLHAEQDLAASRRDQAAYAYRAAVLQAFREVEDAMAGVAFLSEEARTAQREVAADRAACEAARRRYDAGYASYLEQLDSERALLAARIDEDDLHFQRLSAIVALYHSLGGGWSSDLMPRDYPAQTEG